jgi:hypothetical protein
MLGLSCVVPSRTWRSHPASAAAACAIQPACIPQQALGEALELLPSPAFTQNQVELDTVVSSELPGLRDLGIAPQQLEEALRLAAEVLM